MSGERYELVTGDALDVLRQYDDGQVRCVVTSPPYYGLREYPTGYWVGGSAECTHRYSNPQRGTSNDGSFSDERSFVEGSRPMLGTCRWCGAVRVDQQIGLESSVDAYVQRLVEVFREVRRVLTDDGTLWLNLGDSYVTRPRGNKKGDTSTSTLTNPERQDKVYPHGVQYRMRHGRPENDPKALRNQASRSELYRFRSTFIDTNPKNGVERGDRPNRYGDFRGLKHKDLIGSPWLVAFALRADGWYLRDDIIWEKANPLPESVKDRPTRAHEYVFLFSKSPTYFYDHEAMQEPALGRGNHARNKVNDKLADDAARPPGTSPQSGLRIYNLRKNDTAATAAIRSDGGKLVRGFQQRWDLKEAQGDLKQTRNKRDVWKLASEPYKGAHYAVMPTKLVEPCVLAGTAPDDIVMDPFYGSGTVGVVALKYGRRFVGIDLDPKNVALAEERIRKAGVLDEQKESA